MAERSLIPNQHATIHQLQVTLYGPDGDVVIGAGEGLTLNFQFGSVDITAWNSGILEEIVPTVARATGSVNIHTVLDPTYYKGLPSVAEDWSLKFAGDESYAGFSMIAEGGDNSPYEGAVFCYMEKVFLTSMQANMTPESKGSWNVGFKAVIALNPHAYGQTFGG